MKGTSNLTCTSVGISAFWNTHFSFPLRTMSPCCWRSTTESGYTWWPMKWRGAWTTRSLCRTSTAGWRRSTWSTGWRRVWSAASVLSRCVWHALAFSSPFSFSSPLFFPVKVPLMWHFRTSRVFSVFRFRRKRASPSASQIWRLWPKTLGPPQPKGRCPTSGSTFQDDTFTFLYKINSPLRGCLCVQYLHVSAYKINILLFISKSHFPFMFWFIQSWVAIAVLRGVTCFTATLAQTLIA